MAEPTEATDKTEAKAPVLDPNRPVSQQVNRLLDAVPDKAEDQKAEDDKKDDEQKKPDDDKTPDAPDKADKDTESESTKTEDQDEPDDEAELETKKLEDLPPRDRYILERLPDIEVVGHVGENGKDKVLKVKRLQDLPEGFTFAGGRMAELNALAAHNANELNARTLMQEYQQQQQQRDYQKLKDQENTEIASDLKALQKEGLVPKFKYAETDSRFNDDPAVAEANEIYDLMQKTNQSYMNRKLNYRITYRDAADKFYAGKFRNQKPEDKPDKPKLAQEDEERQRTAHKVAARTTSDGDKPRRLPPGATTRDIMRLYEAGRI